MAWLPRLLFRLTLGTSGVLILLVLLAPLLDNGDALPVLALFARDTTVRRTAVASALGLLVTASVFFRPAGPSQPIVRKRKQSRPQPPSAVAGA